MNKILIFGHQNPDTDSITSAISLSYLQNALGKNTEAVALGEINEETKFALAYFKIKTPRIIQKAGEELKNEKNKEVILVDHNEFQQSVSDIQEVEIVMVIDHHKIANFTTSSPLYYRAEPVGSTQTIILKLYKENKINIPLSIAGLMLSGIISDTLLFNSPTCTIEDSEAAKELAKIAEIDLQEYGINLLKAGADLTGKTPEQLLQMDAKTFDNGDKKVRVGQVNTIDFNEVLSKQEVIEKEMNKQIEAHQYDLFILVITNILDNDSEIIAIGKDPIFTKNIVEKAFQINLKNNRAFLKGVVSRKKQIVPPLIKAFSYLI